MNTGMVIWFDQQKGYGFIRKDNGADLFMHTKLIPRNGSIRPGDRVQFKASAKYEGQLAIGVKKI